MIHLAFFCMAAPMISYQSDAVRVDKLLADLSKEAAVRLEASSEVAAEPVVVQFRDRDLDEVLANLARVVGAEWKNEQGVRKLVRPAALLADQQKTDERQFAELLKPIAEASISNTGAFDEAAAKRLVHRVIQEDSDPDEIQREYLHLQSINPITRAACQVLLAMDSKELARTYIGRRIVFSDSPTAAQRAFPSKAKDTLLELKAAVNLMAKANAGTPPQGRRVNYAGLPTLGPGRLEDGYGKTLLSIQRQSTLGFAYRFFMVDQQGRTILSGTGTIPNRTAQLTAVLSHKGKPLVITQLLKDFAFLRQDVGYAAAGAPALKNEQGEQIQISFAIGMAEASGKAPDLGLGDLLHDPVNRDPLGLIFGPLVRQLAEREGKPLIATISDAAMASLMDGINFGTVLTDEDLRQFLEQTGAGAASRVPHATFLEDKEWILVEPSFPAASRAARFNRTALEEFLSAIRSKGVVTLADAARYVERSPVTPRLGSLDLMYVTHADAGIDRKASEWMMSPALPFLVSLTPNQWQRFASGGPFSALSPAQQETIRRWVYDSYDFQRDFERRSTRLNEEGLQTPLYFEPTEQFPSGVPLGSILKLERKETPSVIARAKSGYSFILSMESLAYQDRQGTKGAFLGAKFDREFESFRPANQSTIQIRFILSPDHVVEYSTVETLPLPLPPVKTRDQLPAPFLERYEWARKALGGKG